MGTLCVYMTTSKAVHEAFGTPKQNVFVNSASFNIALQNLSKRSLLLNHELILMEQHYQWFNDNNKSILYQRKILKQIILHQWLYNRCGHEVGYILGIQSEAMDSLPTLGHLTLNPMSPSHWVSKISDSKSMGTEHGSIRREEWHDHLWSLTSPPCLGGHH